MIDLRQSEYEALRATIRERGTMRLWAILAGFSIWGALAISVLITDLQGSITLVPLILLAATFEVNFFVHTGVERIGRYIQVFHEEASGAPGWETAAMNYGSAFPARGLDPLFVSLFSISAAVNFLSALAASIGHPVWIAFSVIAHGIFAYRIVTARKIASAQRAVDLDRFRNMTSK